MAIRIAYLSAGRVPSTSASSIQIMKMCQAMAQEGHRVSLTARRGGSQGNGPAAVGSEAFWSRYGITTRFPVGTVRAAPGLRGLDADLRAFLTARRDRPDLIYTRNPRVAALASALALKTVYEVHDLPAGNLGPWYFRRLVRGRGIRRVVAITGALRDQLVLDFAMPRLEQLIVVEPDAVDLERFDGVVPRATAKAGLGLDPAKPVAGYAGHLYQGRGVDLVLELAGRMPGTAFLIVGGTPADVAAYRNAAGARRLHNVTFTGFVPNQGLPGHLWACDVLLMPYQPVVSVSGGGNTARWASPMKMFEYMAAARPIISSDLPVLREVLNERNSILCRPDDVDAWVDALKRSVGDPGLQSRLAAQARSDVERYTWRSRVRRILDGIG